MPIGPIGQSPIDPAADAPQANNAGTSAAKNSFQPPSAVSQAETPTAANIAAQLVQNARTAQSSGNNPSIAAPMGDLVNAVTSQMGLPEMSHEQRQNLVAQLADDPVVKGLIG